MDCPTYAHYKWDCPRSNGRHKWEWDWSRINHKSFSIPEIYSGQEEIPNNIGLPVRCAYGCGAYGVEWYEFKEVIEGE